MQLGSGWLSFVSFSISGIGRLLLRCLPSVPPPLFLLLYSPFFPPLSLTFPVFHFAFSAPLTKRKRNGFCFLCYQVHPFQFHHPQISPQTTSFRSSQNHQFFSGIYSKTSFHYFSHIESTQFSPSITCCCSFRSH